MTQEEYAQTLIKAASPQERHFLKGLLNLKQRQMQSPALILLDIRVTLATKSFILAELEAIEIQRHTKHLTSIGITAIFALDTIAFLPNYLDWIAFTALFLLVCNACYVQGKFNGLSELSDNDI